MNIKQHFWILPFISFLSGYSIIYHIFRVDTIKTPALVGKTIGNAVAILSDHNLNPRILAYKKEADLPSDTILSQSPAAGQKIKPHQSVFLVISQKPPQPKAPDCIGKSLSTLMQTFTPLNIKPKIYRIPSNYPQNTCIAQLPTAEKPIKNNTIIVYISAGNTKPIVWPHFSKKRVPDVVAFLASYNIEPEIIHANSVNEKHTCEHCYVINQRPLAGSLIALDTINQMHVQIQAQES